MSNNDNNNQNKKPVALILLFFVVVVIVGLIGYYIGTISSSNELNRYKNALDIFYPELPDEIFSITGTVTSISDEIIIEIESLEERVLPGEEYKMEERVVNINTETKIVKWNPYLIIEENPLELQETSILLSELKTGDRISVQASENIKIKKEFTATKIVLIEELEA